MSNTYQKDNPSVTERIDNDSGLKSKARLLSITSLLFIGIMITGAQIEEANTFIFKITISNQSGLPALLLLSIFFLLVRYYSYATKYHTELNTIWTKKLLRHPMFFDIEEHSDEVGGLVPNLQPEKFGLGDPGFGHENYEEHYWKYHIGWFFTRYIDYHWQDQYHETHNRVNLYQSIGLRKYLTVLKLEFKYRFDCIIANREYLDIYGPYFIAYLAILSFVFREEAHSAINILMQFTN